MRWLILFALFSSSLWANSYSTSFPATENPLSEGGMWLNGGTTGLDWTNMRTGTNKAYGTMTSSSSQYADSTAILTGTWAATQSAQATVYVTSAPSGSGVFAEVEIRLRSNITAHSNTGYEINCSVVAANPYIQIVRWNGSLGSFTLLDSRGTTGCANGDVLKATISGSTISAYKNGSLIFSVSDSTLTSGSPGIGTFSQGTFAYDANYGFSAFSATDSGGSSVATASLSSSSLPYGDQVIDTTSADQSVTLRNTGTLTLNVSSIALQTGAQYALDTANSTCYSSGWITTLAASASCTVAATFTPTSTGSLNDNIVFTFGNNSGGSQLNAALSGTGITSSGSTGGGNTITAASCSSTDVQTAFNSVIASTTNVVIPAGSCTWTSAVSLTVPSGSTTLTVSGATTCTGSTTVSCTDITTIIDNLARGASCGSPDNPVLSITTAAASSFLRVTGMTFAFNGSSAQTCAGSVTVKGNSQNIRFDHDHFSQQYSVPLNFNGYTAGVVDHNYFQAPSGKVWNAIKFQEGGWNGDTLGVGDNSWASATTPGGAVAVYVEDNYFYSPTPAAYYYANDCTSGGRYVWRFNTEVNTGHQTHPTGSEARQRGCRSSELYKNSWTGTGAAGGNFNGFFLSSGTSLIWGNTVDNTFANFLTLHSMRRDNTTYSQSTTPNGWGYCGTSFSGTGSAWDQSSSTSTGYRCLDQPGQGVGQQLVNDFPTAKNSVTGTISWPNEALEPVYEWLNTSSATTYLANYNTDALFANSDYYLYTSTFTGATGTGSGTLASRPATCTTGVAYWATDQGSWNQSGSGGQGVLYKCTATNTWTTLYTPYTYPHPLVSSSSDQRPAAPVSLTGTVK